MLGLFFFVTAPSIAQTTEKALHTMAMQNSHVSSRFATSGSLAMPSLISSLDSFTTPDVPAVPEVLASSNVLAALGISASSQLSSTPSPSAKPLLVSTEFLPPVFSQKASFLLHTPTLFESSLLPNLHHIADSTSSDLPSIYKHGLLRALVTYRKGDFVLTGGEPKGVAVEMANAFVAWLNKQRPQKTQPVRVIFIPVPFESLLSSLVAGKGDFIATGLTITPDRLEKVTFTHPYLAHVDEILVTRKGNKEPTSLEDMAGKTVNVLRGSSHVEHLKELSLKLVQKGHQPINIVFSAPGLQTEDLLAMLDAAAIDFVVCNSFEADLWAGVLSNIRPLRSLAIADDQRIAWAVHNNAPQLIASMNAFFADDAGLTLRKAQKLVSQYYASSQWKNNPLNERFQKRVDALWPYFKEYGDKYDFDYFLLLSLAFRESRLVQTARSHKGALGIMQLMPATAKSLGCRNVAQSAEANICCGTYYLHTLRENFFDDMAIREPNRTLFSLAAYNMGPTRLMRIRQKAMDMGLDPNEWFGNVEYAVQRYVGSEPVRYVLLVSAYYMAYSGAAWQYELRRTTLQKQGVRLP